MNTIKYNFYLITFMICLSCNKTPTQTESIPLRSDLSESDFKEAMIGTWSSVYEMPEKENISSLAITRRGKATIIIIEEQIEKPFEGNYSIRFLRPPSRDVMTLAELTVSTSDTNITLSPVYFDLHNALPAEAGLLMRIDGSPYGVLTKM